jgi:GT2 family glycosyltransferase
MCESFGSNFGDVDLSLKVGRLGYRRLWIAAATAYHFEAQTRRNPSVKNGEVRRLARRWVIPHHDPYLPGDLLHAVQTGRVRSPGSRPRVRFQ